jgi:uncharacterized protein (DUF4415 family)
MKKKEKEYEYLETSPEMKARGLRRISRPTFLEDPSREYKSRITIYLDADIVDYYKAVAEREGKGYQTLINLSLRRLIDGENELSGKQSFKAELLKDKKFLEKLKTALAA